jgi:hypothetical protein
VQVLLKFGRIKFWSLNTVSSKQEDWEYTLQRESAFGYTSLAFPVSHPKVVTAGCRSGEVHPGFQLPKNEQRHSLLDGDYCSHINLIYCMADQGTASIVNTLCKFATPPHVFLNEDCCKHVEPKIHVR